MSTDTVARACLLRAVGTLDSSTYLQMRDSVIKAALDEPQAVLVDVSELAVPVPSAWTVFTSARWHVNTWPDIPILLICAPPAAAARISHTGVTRYVPVHPDVDSALASLVIGKPLRRRVRLQLPPSTSSLRGSRDFVTEWLTNWSLGELIPTAKVIVDVLVENVLHHTGSPPVVRLESAGSAVTIAVEDTDDAPAVRREAPTGGAGYTSGLAVVGALSRAWGSSPTPGGKTVWAVVGPENLL